MFEEKDRAMLRGLNKILEDATFPLKKREVQSFAMVMGWVKDLDLRMAKELDKSKESLVKKKSKKKAKKKEVKVDGVK